MSSVHNGADFDVTLAAPGAACDDEDTTTKDDACDEAGDCSGEPYECTPGQCES